jgi:hypothetical protein
MLRNAREQAAGELRYYVDDLDQRLTALWQALGKRPVRHDDDDDHGTRRRHRGTAPPPSRDQLIASIAEALLIERALPTLLDPDAHAVTVILSRVGQSTAAAGTYLAAHCLAQPAWFDDGAVVDGTAVKPIGKGLSGLGPSARDVVLVLRGLFVRDALAGDHGTWFLRAAAAEPDIVRVEIRAGAPQSAADALEAHLAGRRELERVLDAGGALPPNPDSLLPVARTINYRTPLRDGEPCHVEIEDFSTGWVDRGPVRDVPTAVRRAWHLAWSRT